MDKLIKNEEYIELIGEIYKAYLSKTVVKDWKVWWSFGWRFLGYFMCIIIFLSKVILPLLNSNFCKCTNYNGKYSASTINLC